MATKKVGDLIKEARTNAGLTQAQLAKKVDGVTASDISKAERGEKELTQAALKQIAKATGVTQSSLLNAPKGASGKTSSGGKTGGKTGSSGKASAMASATSTHTPTATTGSHSNIFQTRCKARSSTNREPSPRKPMCSGRSHRLRDSGSCGYSARSHRDHIPHVP